MSQRPPTTVRDAGDVPRICRSNPDVEKFQLQFGVPHAGLGGSLFALVETENALDVFDDPHGLAPLRLLFQKGDIRADLAESLLAFARDLRPSNIHLS